MEDILAIVLIFGGGTLIVLAFSPIGRALAERIRGGPAREAGAATQQLEDVLTELQDVRREVGELSERMDFAERLLAKQRESDRLAPPR